MNRKQSPATPDITTTPVKPSSTSSSVGYPATPSTGERTADDKKKYGAFDFGFTPNTADKSTARLKPVGKNLLETPDSDFADINLATPNASTTAATPHTPVRPTRSLNDAFDQTAQDILEQAFEGVNLGGAAEDIGMATPATPKN